MRISRPAEGEFAPYAIVYVDATARELERRGVDVVSLLESQYGELVDLLANSPASIAQHAYAPGKWTLAESIIHMTDNERVWSYRLLRISRNDQTPLPGYDQDQWVPESRSAQRSLDNVLNEFRTVREATLSLVHSLDDIALSRTGTAGDNPVSARALVWLIAGHISHHHGIIAERYLGQPAGR